jgi:hypothetical protein
MHWLCDRQLVRLCHDGTLLLLLNKLSLSLAASTLALEDAAECNGTEEDGADYDDNDEDAGPACHGNLGAAGERGGGGHDRELNDVDWDG